MEDLIGKLKKNYGAELIGRGRSTSPSPLSFSRYKALLLLNINPIKGRVNRPCFPVIKHVEGLAFKLPSNPCQSNQAKSKKKNAGWFGDSGHIQYLNTSKPAIAVTFIIRRKS